MAAPWIRLLVVCVIFGNCVASKFRNCSNGTPVVPLPPTVTETTKVLAALRTQMSQNGLAAYIIPNSDQHLSEYTAPSSKRRGFISGFHGSAGYAVVTLTKAAMWTDGRYFDQAETEMDCNWILQRQGMKGYPSLTTWVKQELKKGEKIGMDPKLLSCGWWDSYDKVFKAAGIDVVALEQNLVDMIWKTRPIPAKTKIEELAVNYTGETWQSKVEKLRNGLREKSLLAVALSDLADVAWLLNLRGTDIPYNPFFFAYVFVSMSEVSLFVDESKLDSTTKKHLCPDASISKDCVKLQKYDTVKAYIDSFVNRNPTSKISLSEREPYFLAKGINKTQIHFQTSPVQLPKAMKNQVEQQGMKIANLKDSVAITQFFSWLEKEIQKGTTGLTELTTSEKLKEFKSKQKDFRGLSFNTIAAFGPNAATIHYRANNFTDRPVDDSAPYLVDSGCQFPEGTTDITRTFHFGKPTSKQKLAFTQVLQGTIDLITAVFPFGTYGSKLDVLARVSLWRNGLNYNHGTGHGIGHYLSVHEGPQAISSAFNRPNEKFLQEGMVLSDEPGYYETGKFGIRLETDMIVVNASTMFNFNNIQYLKFEPITFVPFCTRLLDQTMLTRRQKMWLNQYNKQVRQKLGDELKKIGDQEAYDWMMRETSEIPLTQTVGSAARLNTPLLYLYAVIFVILAVIR